MSLVAGENWAIFAEACEAADRDSLLVDHIISDLPYDDRTHRGHALPNRGRSEVTFPPIDPADYIPALFAYVTGWVVCFCALEQLGAYKDAAGPAWYRAGVWDKINPAPQMNGQGPAQAVEGIAIMWSGGAAGRRRRRPEWQSGGRAGIWRHSPARGVERLHETPKPVSLMVELVEDFTRPGECVWDPFAGSGTTGVACLRTGRRFIGHEINPAVAGIAARRLQAEAAGLDPAIAEIAARRLKAEADGIDLRAADRRQLGMFNAPPDARRTVPTNPA